LGASLGPDGHVIISVPNFGHWYPRLRAMFGIFDYATVPPTASLAAGHLGKARVGTAMGLISAGHSIGAALGAFMGGYLFDATGGYSWLWSSSFGLALLAAAIAGLVPARTRTELAMA